MQARELMRWLRKLTMPQCAALTSDDVERVRASTWRSLTRMGLARTVAGREPFRAFTPKGRQLRAAIRNRDEDIEAEYQRALGGAA